MIIGLPKETRLDEARVGLSPESVKKLCKKGFRVRVERSSGVKAGFPDSDYQMDGVELVDTKSAFSAEIVLKVHRPTPEEISLLKKGALLISFMEPYNRDGTFEKLAQAGIESMAMELIPRTSR